MKQIVLSLGLFFLGGISGFGQLDTIGVEREVDSLMDLSLTIYDQGKYAEAIQTNEQAKQLALQVFGENSKVYARSVFNHGRIYFLMGIFKKAESFYLEAKTIQENILWTDNTDYAWSLNNLGLLYCNQGRYELAEPLLLEAIALRDKHIGLEHKDYFGSIYNLSIVYKATKRYELAESLLSQSISGYQKIFGTDYIRIAWSLGDLAYIHKLTGRYESAVELYSKAIAIIEKNSAQQNPSYAMDLISLGGLYKDLGLYEKTEPLLLKAIKIQEKTLGKESLFYANSLDALANYYLEIGSYETAEKLYLECKTIWEKSTKKDHLGYSTTLSNLANLYREMHRYEEAESLLLATNDIREKLLGKEDAQYARSLNNLARLYINMERYEEALPLLLESITIWEKVYGQEHPVYAEGLLQLGDFYTTTGQLGLAEPLYLKVETIQRKVLGTENVNYSVCLGRLATLYNRNQQYEQAASYFLRANDINVNFLSYACHFLSEYELASVWQISTPLFDEHFSFGVNKQPAISSFTESCFNNSLFKKGFLYTAAMQIQKLALSDSLVTEKYNLLKSYRRRLFQQYSLDIIDRDSMLISDLEFKANTLEKELARTVSGFSEVNRQVTWQEVQASLQPNEAAIEFIHFRYYNPIATDSIYYAALLLKPEMERPAFIPLFEEKQLQALLELNAEQASERLNELYSGETSRTLYQLLWSPLQQYLDDVKTIYFSPNGLLHRINLNAISIYKNTTLADRFDMVVLGSTRQLVTNAPYANIPPTAVIFGGIQYEMDSIAITSSSFDDGSSRRGLSFSQSDSTLRGDNWKYLKYSDKEVDNIQSLLEKSGFQSQVRKGFAATEEAFKKLGKDGASPRILHISTHGFFFPDPSTFDPRKSVVDSDQRPFKNADHPMIRSGLIFAGANYAWQTGKPLGKREDGILTASEISQMDLRNTELAVLSACETGLGDIKGNEGVYGLQRAFKIAGAKKLIMSLWQVPDFQTQELMTVFYQKWLNEKMTVRQAWVAAQKEMRERRYEPFYWAGFVLME